MGACEVIFFPIQAATDLHLSLTVRRRSHIASTVYSRS